MCDRRMLTCLAAAVVVTVASPFGRSLSAAPRVGAGAAPCVVLATDPIQAPKDVNPQPAAALSAPNQERTEALRRPMSEPEVQELIEILRAVRRKEPGPDERLGVGGRTSLERLRVIRDDVTALLVQLHAREMAGQFSATGGAAMRARESMERAFAAIEACVPARFEGRGGPDTYRQSLAIVEKHRSSLEPLVLDFKRWRPETSFESQGRRGKQP